MRTMPVLMVFAILGVVPTLASAQRTPFFGAAGTAFDPEIDVVNSGQILDAQVAVSDDLKYVTINARASSSRLLALRDFTFVGSGVRRGFVGADGGGGDAANGAPGPVRDRGGDAAGEGVRKRVRRPRPKPADDTPEVQPPLPTGILAQPGMTLIGRFED